MSYPGYDPQADPFARQGSPLLAAFSGLVGLGLAGVLVWQTLDLLSFLGDALSELPAGWTAMVVAHFAIAGIAVIGAVLVLARRIAGAFILLTSALFTIVVLLAAPLIAEEVGYTLISLLEADLVGSNFDNLYFDRLFAFEFDNTQATLRLAALALGVLLLIIAVLPPSLKWLRRPRRDVYNEQPTQW